ncbi:MAG: glycerol-3-phosphate dehydrogenase subunit GlpB [Propionibacteriaceae bacterium]|nr:glycerol-3-phosphate dehydrogenase subunit GlpB [Propionibacteriaceae bacterium]
MSQVIVIGAGLSGLVAAIKSAEGGQQVTLISKGLGGLQLSQGTIDIHEQGLAGLESPAPHPYAAIGAENVLAGVKYLAKLLGPEFLVGDAKKNVYLPTAVGAIRPTALIPPSMAAGSVRDGAKWLIVGLRRLKDFNASLIAGNLSRLELPGGGSLSARALTIDVVAREGEVDSSALTFARAFDTPDFRQRLVAAIKPELQPGEAVGLPAILGVKQHDFWRELQASLGCEVFEIPLPPPSVPGMRLNEALTAKAKALGVRFVLGSYVSGFTAAGGKLVSVTVATTGAPQEFKADKFIYAPGGFESGALAMDSHYEITEKVFGLPLHGVAPVEELILPDYWDEQPVFKVGVSVDKQMRPLDAAGKPVYANLHAIGGIIGGAIRWKEKSGEGIALGSAWAATEGSENV